MTKAFLHDRSEFENTFSYVYQQYLMYQLSQQIFKMLTELKKQQLKSDSTKQESSVKDFLQGLKNNKKVETRCK